MLGSLSTKSRSKNDKKKKTIGFFDSLIPERSGESVDSLDFFKPKSLGKAVIEQAKPTSDWAKDWLGFSGEPKGQGHSVDMQPGVSYSPQQMAEAQQQQEQQAAPELPIEAPMNYSREILHVGESKKDEQESGQKIQMLIQELDRLAKSVAHIEKTMILQAINPSAAAKSGKYYENFFEWMLIMVQDARRKVEDSGAWLSAIGKKKPGIHKEMKTNMKIAMSEERTVANQTG